MKLRSLAFGVVMAATMSGPATAAVYTGIWDPPFGAPLAADFSWRGKVEFFVPSACEPAGTAVIDNVTDCGGAAKVTKATVELYDANGPLDLLATLSFDPLSLSLSLLHYLVGDLNQVESTFSALTAPVVEPGVDLTSYLLPAGVPFTLQFTATGPRLYYRDCTVAGRDCVLVGNDDDITHRPRFAISRVPEPASIALAGLALGALGAVRRRRQAAAAG